MLRDAIWSLLNRQPVDVYDVLVNIAACLFIVFLILPLHEFAHGWAARRCGDPTAENAGRLTLNPMASFDPIGCLCMILIGFGWAKPVPVNPRYFRHPRRDTALVALAGPVSNILAAAVGYFIYYLILAVSPYPAAVYAVMKYVILFLIYYISFNVSLAVFNLLPVPPLDGSRIISAFLPPRAAYMYNCYQRQIYMVFLVLLWIGVLNRPIHYLSGFILTGMDFICGLPFRLLGLL